MANKIIEKIEYLTQIHTAWDKSEQRMALRSQPRRYISYDYIGTESWQSQYLRMLAFGKQTQLIRFPLWHAATTLKKRAYKGQMLIEVPIKGMWGYRNIGAVELWTSDALGGKKYDLKYITASGLLGLKKELTGDWYPGRASVIPVFFGVLQQEDKYVNMHSDLTTMMINIELLQNQQAPDFPEAWDEYHDEEVKENVVDRGLPQAYQGAEVFMYEPPWASDEQASFSRNVNRLDNETGVFRYDLKTSDTTQTKQVSYAGLSRAEVYNLQRFFYRCRGKFKSFWMPTWVNDLCLAEVAPAGQIYILVDFDLYWQYYAQSKRRRVAVIFYVDGTAEIVKIAGYTISDDGKRGKVVLQKSLRRTLTKKNVRMISYLCRQRFNSDVMTVDYETTESATMDLEFTEVDA